MICSLGNFEYKLTVMGSTDTKIQTSSLDEQLVRVSTIPLPSKYTPPNRKFGDLFRKHNARKTLYVLKVHQPFEEQIRVESEAFSSVQEAVKQKTQQYTLAQVFQDGDHTDRWVFQALQTRKRLALVIRPFPSDDSYEYANILCELHFASLASKLSTANLHVLVETFAVTTGIAALEEGSSQILVMESVDATLSEIISYRRKVKLDWGVNQFEKLVRDLVEGLAALHQANIAHNDIRPANIYFSSKKNCYVIGSYAKCSKVIPVSAQPAVKVDSQFNASGFSQFSQEDALKDDVYGLGVTLLSAFYLSQPLDRKSFIQQNKNFSSRYEILKPIQSMVSPPDHRATIAEVKAKLLPIDFNYPNMKDLLESMYDSTHATAEDVSSAKLARSWAYQRMGKWSEWKEEYESNFEKMSGGMETAEKAQNLTHLAMIEKLRGESQNSEKYAMKAANLYRSAGNKQIESGLLTEAEQSFKKAVTCSKYYESDPELQLSKSLQGLSKIHAEKNEYVRAKTLAAAASNSVGKNAGKQTLEWCQARLFEGKIETQYGSFSSADQILEKIFNIARKKQSKSPQAKLLTAQILKARGFNFMKQASHQDQNRDNILNLAEINLNGALHTYQSYDEEHPQEVASILKVLGEVHFKRENYQQAKIQFSKALVLMNFDNLPQTREKGELLCLKGTTESFLGDQNLAVQDFDRALKIYRKLYGSDNNKWSALAIGNLGRVYANSKEVTKARQCLNVSLSILSQVAGRDDPDFQHFTRIEKHLDELL